MTHAPAPQPSVAQADLDALADQLGRVPRGVVSIAARCACGEDFRETHRRDAADRVDGKLRGRCDFAQESEAARRQARLARGRVDVARDEI